MIPLQESPRQTDYFSFDYLSRLQIKSPLYKKTPYFSPHSQLKTTSKIISSLNKNYRFLNSINLTSPNPNAAEKSLKIKNSIKFHKQILKTVIKQESIILKEDIKKSLTKQSVNKKVLANEADSGNFRMFKTRYNIQSYDEHIFRTCETSESPEDKVGCRNKSSLQSGGRLKSKMKKW